MYKKCLKSESSHLPQLCTKRLVLFPYILLKRPYIRRRRSSARRKWVSLSKSGRERGHSEANSAYNAEVVVVKAHREHPWEPSQIKGATALSRAGLFTRLAHTHRGKGRPASDPSVYSEYICVSEKMYQQCTSNSSQARMKLPCCVWHLQIRDDLFSLIIVKRECAKLTVPNMKNSRTQWWEWNLLQ